MYQKHIFFELGHGYHSQQCGGLIQHWSQVRVQHKSHQFCDAWIQHGTQKWKTVCASEVSRMV